MDGKPMEGMASSGMEFAPGTGTAVINQSTRQRQNLLPRQGRTLFIRRNLCRACASTRGAAVLVRQRTNNERELGTQAGQELAGGAGVVLDWKSDKPYEAALDVDLGDGGAVSVLGFTIRHSSPSIAQN